MNYNKLIIITIIFAFSGIVSVFTQEQIQTTDKPAKQEIATLPDEQPVIESLEGEWRGFFLKKDTYTGRVAFTYVFNDKGEWMSRSDDNPDELIMLGNFRSADRRVFLFPLQEADKEKALIAAAVDKDTFVLGNEHSFHVMEFKRISGTPEWDIKDLYGEWEFIQSDLDSNEERKAPYTITFHKDGRYTAEHSKDELPSEYASGTYLLENGLLKLKNKFTGDKDAFWHQPEFFRDKSKIVLNRPTIYVYGEKK